MQEELTLGEHGEYLWQTNPILLTDVENFDEAEEEEAEA